MKKYPLSVILAAISLGVHAEYNRLVFHTIGRDDESIGLNDLNITYTNEDMIATSGSEYVVIPLKSLISMEFSDGNSVGSISGVEDGNVTVFSVNGVCLGNFDSRSAALNALPSGVYVLKSKNDIIYKVSIKK